MKKNIIFLFIILLFSSMINTFILKSGEILFAQETNPSSVSPADSSSEGDSDMEKTADPSQDQDIPPIPDEGDQDNSRNYPRADDGENYPED